MENKMKTMAEFFHHGLSRQFLTLRKSLRSNYFGYVASTGIF